MHLRPERPERLASDSVSQVLTIETHSLLKNDLRIINEAGELLYTASWRPGFPTAVWTLKNRGRDVATLRRKALAPARTSVVKFGDHVFTLRKKLAIARATEIRGGPFHGAILYGSLTGMDFQLQHRGVLIADAKAKLLSMKARHSVRLHATDDPIAEIVTALMMVDLLIQKHEEF
jgi:uncharacterized protein YxjI